MPHERLTLTNQDLIEDLSDLLGYDYYFASIVELKTLTLDRSN